MYLIQDSIIQQNSGIRQMDTAELDRVFREMESKEREMDSLAGQEVFLAVPRAQPPPPPKGFDTSALPYLFDQDSFAQEGNPLLPYHKELFHARDTSKAVFIESIQSQTEVPERIAKETGRTLDPNPDWMLLLIIGSLVLLAWIKLFYNKFMDQTMQSVRNFQLSLKLLRDQNLFSRRVAFLLNLHFILIGGAFVYLVISHFNLKPFPYTDFVSFLIYSGMILAAMLLRYLVSHLTGILFLQVDVFRAYLHQIFLLYKNLGIYLVIFVIGANYMHQPFKDYLIYSGLALATIVFLFRFVKGFQILLKKDVLIFYLILYLCTLEFLPLVIFYKFISSSGLTG